MNREVLQIVGHALDALRDMKVIDMKTFDSVCLRMSKVLKL